MEERGKKGMNNKEGKEGSWQRGKQGMKNKEGEEELWKRGTVKPEKNEGEITNKVEKEKNLEQNIKSSLRSLLRFSPRVFPFHFIGHLSLPFAALTFPLFHGSSFPSLLFIPFFPLFHGSSFPSLFFKLFLYDLQPSSSAHPPACPRPAQTGS